MPDGCYRASVRHAVSRQIGPARWPAASWLRRTTRNPTRPAKPPKKSAPKTASSSEEDRGPEVARRARLTGSVLAEEQVGHNQHNLGHEDQQERDKADGDQERQGLAGVLADRTAQDLAH